MKKRSRKSLKASDEENKEAEEDVESELQKKKQKQSKAKGKEKVQHTEGIAIEVRIYLNFTYVIFTYIQSLLAPLQEFNIDGCDYDMVLKKIWFSSVY